MHIFPKPIQIRLTLNSQSTTSIVPQKTLRDYRRQTVRIQIPKKPLENYKEPQGTINDFNKCN